MSNGTTQQIPTFDWAKQRQGTPQQQQGVPSFDWAKPPSHQSGEGFLDYVGSLFSNSVKVAAVYSQLSNVDPGRDPDFPDPEMKRIRNAIRAAQMSGSGFGLAANDFLHFFGHFTDNGKAAIGKILSAPGQAIDEFRRSPVDFIGQLGKMMVTPIGDLAELGSGLQLTGDDVHALTPEEKSERIKNVVATAVMVGTGMGASKALGLAEDIGASSRLLARGKLARRALEHGATAGASGVSYGLVKRANEPDQLSEMIINGMMFGTLGMAHGIVFGKRAPRSALQSGRDLSQTRQLQDVESKNVQELTKQVEAITKADSPAEAVAQSQTGPTVIQGVKPEELAKLKPDVLSGKASVVHANEDGTVDLLLLKPRSWLPEPHDFRLPEELEFAIPRYGYGKKLFDLHFESHYDLAAYIIAGKGESRAHGKYLAAVTKAGLDVNKVIARGNEIRDLLKYRAQTSLPDISEIDVPAGETFTEAKSADVAAIIQDKQRHSEAKKLLAKTPPVAPGFTRLYRGETKGEFKTQDVEGTSPTRGQWFSRHIEDAQYYADRHGHGDISYIDVPTSDVEKYLVRNQPAIERFSGHPQAEYVLPPELAEKRVTINEGFFKEHGFLMGETIFHNGSEWKVKNATPKMLDLVDKKDPNRVIRVKKSAVRRGAKVEVEPETVAPQVPSWVSETIDRLHKEALARGLPYPIEILSAQRFTAKQIVERLKDKFIGVEDPLMMVRAVRSKLGIPSMDQKEEFEAWVTKRGLSTIPQQIPGGVRGEFPFPQPPVVPEPQVERVTPTKYSEAELEEFNRQSELADKARQAEDEPTTTRTPPTTVTPEAIPASEHEFVFLEGERKRLKPEMMDAVIRRGETYVDGQLVPVTEEVHARLTGNLDRQIENLKSKLKETEEARKANPNIGEHDTVPSNIRDKLLGSDSRAATWEGVKSELQRQLSEKQKYRAFYDRQLARAKAASAPASTPSSTSPHLDWWNSLSKEQRLQKLELYALNQRTFTENLLNWKKGASGQFGESWIENMFNKETGRDPNYVSWKESVTPKDEPQPDPNADPTKSNDDPPAKFVDRVLPTTHDKSMDDHLETQGLSSEEKKIEKEKLQSQLEQEVTEALPEEDQQLLKNAERARTRHIQEEHDTPIDSNALNRIARTNRMTISDSGTGRITVSDLDSDEVLGTFDSPEDAADFINTSGQANGPNMTSGGGSGGLPPEGTPPSANDFPYQNPLKRFAHWLTSEDFISYLDTKAIATRMDVFLKNFDTRNGTRIYERVMATTQRLGNVRDSMIKPFVEKLKPIQELVGKMSSADQEMIQRSRNTMGPDEVVARFKMTPLEVAIARQIHLSGVNLSRIFKYMDRIKKIESDYPDQLRKSDPNADLQYRLEKRNARVKFNIDDLHKQAAEKFQQIESLDDPPSIGAIARLARSFDHELPQREFDAKYKLTPQQILIRNRLDALQRELEGTWSTSMGTNLDAILTHARLYTNGNINRALKHFNVPTQQFIKNMVRTGQLSPTEMNPIRHMQRLMKAGFDVHSGFERSVRQAHEALVEEARKANVPTTERKHIVNVGTRYLEDVRHFPDAADKYAGSVVARTFNKMFGEGKVSEEASRNWTNGILTLMNSATQGFRVMSGLTHFTSGFAVSWARRDIKYTARMLNAGSSVMKHPERLEEVKAAGALSSITQLWSYSPAEEAGAFSSSRISQGIKKLGEKGFKYSFLPHVYDMLSGGHYLTTKADALAAITKLGRKEITWAKLKQDLFLDTYAEPDIRAFRSRVDAGKPEEAAQYLATQAVRDLVGVFGNANHPYKWGSNFGRMLGQYGQWPTWLRSTVTAGLTRGTVKQRVGFALKFGAFSWTTTELAKEIGISQHRWDIIKESFPLSWLGGPLVTVAEDIHDALSGTGFVQALAVRHLKNMLPAKVDRNTGQMVPNLDQLYIPYSSAVHTMLNAIEDYNQGEVARPAFELLGFRRDTARR